MSSVTFDELATCDGSLATGVGVVDSDFSTTERRRLETDLRGWDMLETFSWCDLVVEGMQSGGRINPLFTRLQQVQPGWMIELHPCGMPMTCGTRTLAADGRHSKP